MEICFHNKVEVLLKVMAWVALQPALFAEEVPGMFFFLGVAPDDPSLIYPNHSPRFYADERALPIGVTAMVALTLDYLASGAR